jgi:hypothetical protein
MAAFGAKHTYGIGYLLDSRHFSAGWAAMAADG